MIKIDWKTVLKGALTVASVGIALGQSYFANKELDEKVAEKVAEALENK